MKDAVVVLPLLVTGAVILEQIEMTQHRHAEAPVPLLVALGVVGLMLLGWYRMKSRTAERLKALEVERARPVAAAAEASPPRPAAAPAGVVMALLGTVGVSGVAWLATLTTDAEPSTVWSIAGLLGFTSTVCGTVLLARQHPAPRDPEPRAYPYAYAPVNGWDPAAKAVAADPDAIDLVGRRG